ncbi:IS66 family insertion sequence element accessory protein TnpA [Heliophilum fasciatum]|uniref:Transposase n=1 Tax=Heliophilum fasciatum TaxID=35700 RepID=A0A4R2RMR1_9FIRM|nr:hypothetical protein [Heliophilum fasciatum]MCW2279182.1 hypothetical protein [Heliophilum fasciatum]TCP61041.1 hypothetical protein EDD73_13138 [Heliophilum fasciatum]
MTPQEKEALVAECRASGTTAKAWCEEKGIPYGRYMNWAREVNRKANHDPQQWADVTLVKEQPCDEIKIQCGKWSIGIKSGFDSNVLTEVLKAMDTVC